MKVPKTTMANEIIAIREEKLASIAHEYSLKLVDLLKKQCGENPVRVRFTYSYEELNIKYNSCFYEHLQKEFLKQGFKKYKNKYQTKCICFLIGKDKISFYVS